MFLFPLLETKKSISKKLSRNEKGKEKAPKRNISSSPNVDQIKVTKEAIGIESNRLLKSLNLAKKFIF